MSVRGVMRRMSMVGLVIIYYFQTNVCTWSLINRRAASQQITGQGVLTDYVIVPSIFLLINYDVTP